MSSPKDKNISQKEPLIKKEYDVDDLKQFVQKKQSQNVALKKIIANLNTDENHKINK